MLHVFVIVHVDPAAPVVPPHAQALLLQDGIILGHPLSGVPTSTDGVVSEDEVTSRHWQTPLVVALHCPKVLYPLVPNTVDPPHVSSAFTVPATAVVAVHLLHTPSPELVTLHTGFVEEQPLWITPLGSPNMLFLHTAQPPGPRVEAFPLVAAVLPWHFNVDGAESTLWMLEQSVSEAHAVHVPDLHVGLAVLQPLWYHCFPFALVAPTVNFVEQTKWCNI